MLKKALQFAWSHKLAAVAFCLPVVGFAAAAAIVTYQHRQKPRPQVYPPVRDAVDEPVAPPTLDELPVVTREGAPWMH